MKSPIWFIVAVVFGIGAWVFSEFKMRAYGYRKYAHQKKMWRALEWLCWGIYLLGMIVGALSYM